MTDSPNGPTADRFAIVFQKLAEAQAAEHNIRIVFPDPFPAELQELEQLRKIVADIRHPYQPSYTST